MNRLTIRNDTSLQQLQEFLGDKGEQGKLYGKKRGDNIVLYVKEKATTKNHSLSDKWQSFKHSLPFVAKERRNLARQGIEQMMNRTLTTDGKNNRGLRTVFDRLLEKMKGQEGQVSKPNRVGDLKRDISLVLPLSRLVMGDQTQNDSHREITQQLKKLDLPKFSLETGNQRTVDGEKGIAKSISIGGETYHPDKLLNSGGAGSVFLYKSATTDTQIAVKVIKTSRLEIASEISMHARIQKQGGENIIKLISAGMMGDDQVGIAMELAPGGDVHKIGKKVASLLTQDTQNRRPGQLTPKEAELIRLTLIKDMAEGLKSMHSEQGFTHYDFKGSNVMIDKSGVGKVADFGSAFSGKDMIYSKYPFHHPQNPIYKAPERFVNEDKDYAIKGDHGKKVRNLIDSLLNKLNLKKDLPHQFLDKLSPASRTPETGTGINLKLTDKVDIWGLGSAGLELFTDKPMILKARNVGPYDSALDKIMISFHEKGGTAIKPSESSSMEGHLSESTGDPKLDTFFNELLHPDPEKRPSAEKVLSNSLFDNPNIGSTAVRNVIVALGTGNQTQIDQAISELTKSMPPQN